jgi:NAD(P)-dependent dehydrogenase (short-subunit alcohol dehydrogenase family)
MPSVLITGANRGLGLEFVQQYAGDNWDIIAACRAPATASKLQALAAKNSRIKIEELNVAEENSIKALAKKLDGAAIDVLINNAGIFSGGKGSGVADGDDSQNFGSIDGEAWEKVLRINTISPILMVQAFVPHLLRGKQKKAINITSRMGSIAEMGSGYIAYRTSKSALNAAMLVAAHDLKDHNITIVNLHPGWVKTDMGGPDAMLEAESSILGMREVIAGLGPDDTGRFLSYEGQNIPW